MFEHGGVGFVFPQLGFESDGIVDTQWQTEPLKFPWFKLLSASVTAFIVSGQFGIGIFGGADEAAVHAIDEDIDDFVHCGCMGAGKGVAGLGAMLISMDLLVGVRLSRAIELTGTSTLASGK